MPKIFGISSLWLFAKPSLLYVMILVTEMFALVDACP